MNEDTLIKILRPEINQKCCEIRNERQEKRMNKIFIFLCIMTVILPPILVFNGFGIMPLFIIVIIFSISLLVLLPVILNQKKGTEHESIRPDNLRMEL
jgi:hypothetical protein